MPDASTRIPCSSQNMPPTWRNLHERHEHMIQKRSNKINEVSKVNLTIIKLSPYFGTYLTVPMIKPYITAPNGRDIG